MKKHLLLTALLPGFTLMANAQHKPDSIALNRTRNVAVVQHGIASFYHDKFEGRSTATGEIFTQAKMTAACNTLPLNCYVRVTNLRNKKSVIVRINDRMHHLNTRVIDLSRTAAGKLGYVGRGLTKVKVEYLGRKKPDELADDTP